MRVRERPRRVISTNGSTTENLLRLGLEGSMVGTAYQDNPVAPDLLESYQRVPVISRQYPFREQVLELEPDFIYGWNTAFAPQAVGDVNYYHRLGTATFVATNTAVRPQRIANFVSDMTLLGKIFDINDRTQALVGSVYGRIDAVRDAVSGAAEPPTVLIGQYRLNGVFSSYADFTLMGEMIDILGAVNMFKQGGLHSPEGLLELDPDCIVVVHMFKTDEEAENFLELIRTHPVLSRLRAVSGGRLHPMPLAEVYAAGVRIPDGLERLSRLLYPDLFPDSAGASSLFWENPHYSR